MTLRQLANALERQARIINALMIRDVQGRFGATKAGYLWAFLTPLLQIAVLYTVWIYLRAKTADMPLILFLITGVIPFWTFNQVMMRTANSVGAVRQFRAFAEITVLDVAFAKIILESVTMILVFFLMVFCASYIGDKAHVENPAGVISAFALVVTLGAGMGLLLSGLRPLFPSIMRLLRPALSRPLFFTSGIFFTADMLPHDVRQWLLYNPLLHVIEFLRSAFFYEFESPYYDLTYAGAFDAALFALGLMMLRANAHRVLDVDLRKGT